MRVYRVSTDESSPFYATRSGDRFLRCRGNPYDGFSETSEEVTPLRFHAPVEPVVVFAIGVNYREHAVEMNQPIPNHPVVTMKSISSVIGTGADIELPRFLRSDSVDFEAELAILIGRRCKNVRPEQALEYVAGYTVANDVSARDWQKIYSGGQWCKGKGFDTFCPLGPVLVTADEIADPGNLAIRSELNGEVFQNSNTRDLIFSVAQLICFLSGSATLLPGTLILTGTPPGVGSARKPPVYLALGDVVTVEIESIGRLSNPVVEENV